MRRLLVVLLYAAAALGYVLFALWVGSMALDWLEAKQHEWYHGKPRESR